MPTSLGEPASQLARHKHPPRKITMDSNESQPKTMVRFDFAPGASPDDIAAAIRRAFEKAMKERNEAIAKAKATGAHQ